MHACHLSLLRQNFCRANSVVSYLIFKMPLLLEEAVDIIAVYFECLGNATIAERVYAVRYPQRRRYDSRMFNRLASRFRTTGSIRRPVYRRRRRGRTEENIVNVLAYVEFNPQISIRLIVRDLGVTRSTVHRILLEER